jgi:hypothetical protein
MFTCVAAGHVQMRGHVGRQWSKVIRMQRGEQTAKARQHKLQTAAGIIQRYHSLANLEAMAPRTTQRKLRQTIPFQCHSPAALGG